jgi:cell division protein FtsI/penicillin-binding protein 2
MLGRTDSRRRLLFVLGTFVVVGASLVSRLVWWQVVQHDSLSAAASQQSSLRYELPVQRGTIYDRSGTVVLATSVIHYRVTAAPDQLTALERRDVGAQVAAILGLNPDDTATLGQAIQVEKPYVILAHSIDQAAADRITGSIASGALPGISLEPEPVRVYPQQGGSTGTSLAAHLLGFVNSEGQGQYGVEERYQSELAGTPQVLLAQRDAAGRPLTDAAQQISPGVPGTDLRLTVDADLQLAVEQEVLAASVADRALGVSAIVMDPKTGAIFAEANYPSYDANGYQAVASKDPSRFIDPIVSYVYEPGSVFKLLTVLAGFEQGTVQPTTKILDSGSLALDGGRARIYDSDKRPMGWITAQDVVAFSRNVGAAKIALGLGKTTARAASILAGVWARLGVGQKTGVDVAGEAAGLVNDPAINPWRQIDLANGAFGQGVAVTQIQLATAYAAMINGGTLPQPYVVAAIGDREVTPVSRGQVIGPAISRMLVDLMSHVVHTVPWYAQGTLVKGYSIGGKTGTAEIWDPKLNHGLGAWKPNRFNNTFVGYIGRGTPELVIAVTIREATPLHISQGNLPLAVESYELFRRIATDSMTMLDLPKPILPPATADR